MTLTMLPPAPKDVGRLSDVFVSALGAIVGGDLNRLKLPRVDSAIVVVIDGLGYQNLTNHLAHARTLGRLIQQGHGTAIRSGFPSTTAVSLTSLATGLRAGTHGVLGYQVAAANGGVRNMLNGWRPNDDPRLWQTNETVSEAAAGFGLAVNMVASPEYEGTGFTIATLPNAKFTGAADLAIRCETAHKLAQARKSLTYLYFAELDQAAHRFGVASSEWLRVLEEIDSALGTLGGSYGVLITADHGIIDVQQSNHTYLDEVPGFTDAVQLAVGDPRALFCYGNRELATAALTESGFDGYLVTFDDLVASGWVSGSVTIDQVPDFVLISRGDKACYDRRTAKQQSLKMVGQHGGIDDRETRVPLIRAGLFA